MSAILGAMQVIDEMAPSRASGGVKPVADDCFELYYEIEFDRNYNANRRRAIPESAESLEQMLHWTFWSFLHRAYEPEINAKFWQGGQVDVRMRLYLYSPFAIELAYNRGDIRRKLRDD